MDCGADKGTTSLFSMWMARERRPANAPCQRQRIGLRYSGVCAPCVLRCSPGTQGEIVRTRTTVLQAHTHQWIATFGNPGWEYRTELCRAVTAIQSYLKVHHSSEERALLRLNGQYGTGAVLADLAGLAYVMCGKDYQILVVAHLRRMARSSLYR